MVASLPSGAEYTGDDPSSLVLTNAGTVQSVTQVAGLFDPVSDLWRPMSDMIRFIHYHNVSVLAPDGRVIATAAAGTSGPFGDDDSVEAFEPPYLFRGSAPESTRFRAQSWKSGVPIHCRFRLPGKLLGWCFSGHVQLHIGSTAGRKAT